MPLNVYTRLRCAAAICVLIAAAFTAAPASARASEKETIALAKLFVKVASETAPSFKGARGLFEREAVLTPTSGGVLANSGGYVFVTAKEADRPQILMTVIRDFADPTELKRQIARALVERFGLAPSVAAQGVEEGRILVRTTDHAQLTLIILIAELKTGDHALQMALASF